MILNKNTNKHNTTHMLHMCAHTVIVLALILTQFLMYKHQLFAINSDDKNDTKEFDTTYYSNIIKLMENSQNQISEQNASRESETVKIEVPTEQWADYGVCSYSATKTYEEGNIKWDPTSSQYQVMSTLHVNDRGIYESTDGYLAVALGSYYGPVGSKFRITLDTGITLKVIKADAKANKDTVNGCYQHTDGSVVEFVINAPTAFRFFPSSNGYVNNGNFNNHPDYQGAIVKVEKLV